jgi:hypothetical protein
MNRAARDRGRVDLGDLLVDSVCFAEDTKRVSLASTVFSGRRRALRVLILDRNLSSNFPSFSAGRYNL